MRSDKIKFRVVNGIPQDHSYTKFNTSKVFLRVTNEEKTAKMNFVASGDQVNSSVTFYMGVLAGKLMTQDIFDLNLIVELEVWEME
jgi:hypothetical protein